MQIVSVYQGETGATAKGSKALAGHVPQQNLDRISVGQRHCDIPKTQLARALSQTRSSGFSSGRANDSRRWGGQ